MRLRTVNCYLYDNGATASLLQGVIRYIQARSLMNVVLQKSWVHGFHVKATYPAAEADNGLEAVIRRLAERYGRPRPQAEYRKYEAILHKLAGLEDYKESYLPLCQDGEVTIEESDELLRVNPFGSSRVNYEIELLKSHLLVDLYDTWRELPEDRQNIECAKMFMIIVNRSSGGLKYGYLSLRSNFEDFKTRIGLSCRREEAEHRIREVLFNRTEDEQEFIEHGIKRFAEGRYDREFIFGRLQIFVDCLLSVLSQGCDNGELSFDLRKHGRNFVQQFDAFNDFHWNFSANSAFLKKVEEKGFLIYRFLVSAIYSLMSMLHVSAVRKQRIIGLVSESVEQGFSMGWRDGYLETDMFQSSAEASEKIFH